MVFVLTFSHSVYEENISFGYAAKLSSKPFAISLPYGIHVY
jgi:hypothetical protein